jgi:hypothetical protein
MADKTSYRWTSEEAFAKYYRYKCINLLEKLAKNLFRMFRDESTTKKQLLTRFFELKDRLDKLWDVFLDTEYHSETRKYIEVLGNRLQWNFDLDEIRGKQMATLNRLQKLKNITTYKRKKAIKPYEV